MNLWRVMTEQASALPLFRISPSDRERKPDSIIVLKDDKGCLSVCSDPFGQMLQYVDQMKTGKFFPPFQYQMTLFTSKC